MWSADDDWTCLSPEQCVRCSSRFPSSEDTSAAPVCFVNRFTCICKSSSSTAATERDGDQNCVHDRIMMAINAENRRDRCYDDGCKKKNRYRHYREDGKSSSNDKDKRKRKNSSSSSRLKYNQFDQSGSGCSTPCDDAAENTVVGSEKEKYNGHGDGNYK